MDNINEEEQTQVISKERVTEHGEVYTSKREVNDMLDLVKHETERIDSRFLEPACGTGNFLIEILERKMQIVIKKYKRNQHDFERYTFLAISSIYGIDKLQDNVLECRARLFDNIVLKYKDIFEKKIKPEFLTAIQFLLERNIIWGNALSFTSEENTNNPIIFSEWSFPFNNSKIKRKDFIFEDLLDDIEDEGSLFSSNHSVSDTGKKIIPPPKEIKNFPLMHYLKIGESND